MNPGQLNKQIEIWRNELVKNDFLEWEPMPTLVKTIWAQIVPKTGSLITGRAADTILSKTTHVVKVRYESGKAIQPDYWIKYIEAGTVHTFEIDYILNPYFKNESLELFCQEVI